MVAPNNSQEATVLIVIGLMFYDRDQKLCILKLGAPYTDRFLLGNDQLWGRTLQSATNRDPYNTLLVVGTRVVERSSRVIFGFEVDSEYMSADDFVQKKIASNEIVKLIRDDLEKYDVEA